MKIIPHITDKIKPRIQIPDRLKTHCEDPDASKLVAQHLRQYMNHLSPLRRIVIVCIGTDRSTGDSLGPLVGQKLIAKINRPVQLFGKLDEPIHALNLGCALEEIKLGWKHPFILAIDASLGQLSSVGSIQCGIGPVRPGLGVQKDLPPVGDLHITGIVNVGGFMKYFVLQNTRLSIVMRMADIIADSISSALEDRMRHPITESF